MAHIVRWAGGPRPLLFDLAVAGFFTWLAITNVSAPVAWPPVVAAAVFGALLVRRRFPLAALVIVGAALVAGANLLPLVVAVYTLASRRGPGRQTAAGGAVALAAFLLPAGIRWSEDWPYVLLGAGVFLLVPLLAGLWWHQRAKLLAALRERAEQAERERDLLTERAVVAERRRIAGEMHDVVAHRVSVIAVQAGALTVTCDGQAAAAAEVIRQNSTAALTELREVLRVLRDGEAEVHPPSGLDGLGALVDDARAAGTRAELSLPDPLPEVAIPVGRAAYRVVQEALTNIGKHAPGARARVAVAVRGAELTVEVADDGPGDRAPAHELPSSGFGLVGMRERVGLAGGTVHTGRSGSGFLVRAVFPLTEDEEAG
ncbi:MULTISPECIES: sensor histidine kinase [Amycolatopsis]|uniref:histidine kinase n=1 Tax=Amycolatopsis tucumanensis TaxID=401106 RepID=A0ABP7HPQ6_9PSEU|nr:MULTISPECIES: histidine kinase [Amycolatopsis]MCF6422077.1 two-component sensor histidine kinase [Amycolatopsis tucumanensis]